MLCSSKWTINVGIINKNRSNSSITMTTCILTPEPCCHSGRCVVSAGGKGKCLLALQGEHVEVTGRAIGHDVLVQNNLASV